MRLGAFVVASLMTGAGCTCISHHNERPELHALEPAVVEQGGSPPGTLRGQRFFGRLLETPRGGASAVDMSFRITFLRGDQRVSASGVAWQDSKTVLLEIPAQLELGEWDVELLVPGGDVAMLVGALTVVDRVVDAGEGDGGGSDDGGFVDAGADDGGVVDSGADDGGVTDAGADDGGVGDAGADDGGVADAGVSDAGVGDGGVVDAGTLDASVPVCGDGVVNPGEACDDVGPSARCTHLCTSRFARFGIGDSHSCLIRADAGVKCWGLNGAGQLGLGDSVQRGHTLGSMGASLPGVSLPTGRRAVNLCGGGFHTCALLDDGTVRCWGDNGFGQLGIGNTQTIGNSGGEMGDALQAVALGSGRTAVAIACAEEHTCALLDEGSVKCWGRNASGQLGLGDTFSRGDGPGEMGDALPPVPLSQPAVAIATGNAHSVALLRDGTVRAWGWNQYGQLGLGHTTNIGTNAGQVASLAAIDLGPGQLATAIVAGDYTTCAKLAAGPLKCWGRNTYGELGQGDTQSRGDGAGEMGAALGPVDLGAGRTAAHFVGARWSHCALLADGAVKCWGFNDVGQLGQGNTLYLGNAPGEMGDALPTVSLGTAAPVTGVAGRRGHYCALFTDETLKCWGWNFAGQLGVGSTSNRGDQLGEMGTGLPFINLGP